MSVQSRIHHLSDILVVDDEDWRKDWPYLLGVGICTILTGPLLLLGFAIRRWNDTNTPWDAADHWVGTRKFALTFAIADILVVIAYVHFRLQSAFITLMLWYLVCTLLAPALALLIEQVDPRRITAIRVRLPSEQPPPPPPSTTILTEKPLEPTKQKKPTATRRPAPKPKKQDVPSILGVRIFQGGPKERETPVQFTQTSLLAHDDGGTFTASSGNPDETPSVEPTVPSSEPKPTTKRERRNPESLDSLF